MLFVLCFGTIQFCIFFPVLLAILRQLFGIPGGVLGAERSKVLLPT